MKGLGYMAGYLKFKTDPVYQHLLKTFGQRSKTPENVFWYFYRDFKAKRPQLLGKSMVNTVMNHIDNLMLNNPYELSTIRQRIPLVLIDRKMTGLSKSDSWHIDYNDPKRISGMLDSVFDSAWLNDSRDILSLDEVVNGTMKILYQTTPANALNKSTDYWRNAIVQNNHLHQLPVNKNVSQPLCMGVKYYNNTIDLADRLHRQAEKNLNAVDDDLLSAAISNIEKQFNNKITLDDAQISVVRNMLEHPLSLVMGYAGTGKTTLLGAVAQYLSVSEEPLMLTAISGKACQNLNQKTGHEALTVAKILASLHKPDFIFEMKNLSYLIIDEISMVDELQLNTLLSMIGKDTHVIMLGDRAQLPAVGGVGTLTSQQAWETLAIKHPDGFFMHELTHVYRQTQNDLLSAATAIRNQDVPQEFDNTKLDRSLRYFSHIQVDTIVDSLYPGLLQNRNHNTLHKNQITIIAPTNRDVDLINLRLHQQNLLKQNIDLKDDNKVSLFNMTKGDRVLVTKNMHNVQAMRNGGTIDLFNGFVGTVEHVFKGQNTLADQTWQAKGDPFDSKDPHIIVKFDRESGASRECYISMIDLESNLGKKYLEQADDDDVAYADVRNLKLGYALTVHKAQGSTMNTVIVYIPQHTNIIMMQRELLYTALTRASDRLIFVSDGDINQQFFERFVGHSVYDGKLSYLSVAIKKK